jgi:hypothetical protein
MTEIIIYLRSGKHIETTVEDANDLIQKVSEAIRSGRPASWEFHQGVINLAAIEAIITVNSSVRSKDVWSL